MKKALLLFSALITVLVLTGCGEGASKKELHVYYWADYIKPSLVKQFEKECNCKVVLDTFDSNEAMYAKMKAGASGYDLIFPSNYYVDLMRDQNLLQTINPDLIPNLKHMDLPFLEKIHLKSFDYAVPYMVFYAGIGYRKDKVKDLVHSWTMFERQDLHGRMTMLNDVRHTIGAALLFLGYSVNTVKEDEINAAADQLIKWKKNLAKFESEQYKNGLATAEYLVAQGFSGDILQVANENASVGYFLPKEGATIACDCLSIPKNAKQVELAHAFINFLNDPQIVAENMEFVCFLSPNSGAYPFLSEKVRNNQGVFPPKEIMDKSEIILELGLDTRFYNKAWDRIKGAD